MQDKPVLPIHKNCRCKYVEIQIPENEASKNEIFQEAIKTGIEAGILPTGFGESIGAIKIATLLATTQEIWAAKVRSLLLNSKELSLEQLLDASTKLGKALDNDDIETILKMYNHYK